MQNAHDNTPDELNPNLMFNSTATQLLLDIASGKIDAQAFAIKQLKGRGINPTTGIRE